MPVCLLLWRPAGLSTYGLLAAGFHSMLGVCMNTSNPGNPERQTHYLNTTGSFLKWTARR